MSNEKHAQRKGLSSLRKALAILCSLTLIAALVPVVAFADGTATVRVARMGQYPNEFSVQMTVDGVEQSTQDTLNVREGAVVVFTITPNQGYTVDTVGAGVYALPNHELIASGSQNGASYRYEFTANAGVQYEFEGRVMSLNQGGQGNQGGQSGPSLSAGDVLVGVRDSRCGSVMYKLDNGEWQGVANDGKKLNASDLEGVSQVFVKAMPNEGQSLDKAVSEIAINGNRQDEADMGGLADGTFVINYDSQNYYWVNVNFMQTRSVTVVLGEHSLAMLNPEISQMTVGYGDANDVAFTKEQNGQPIAVAPNTSEKVGFSFAIDSEKYFIPTVRINGVDYDTFDTGVHVGDKVVIGAVIRGEAATCDVFAVDLTVGAMAQVANASEEAINAEARYYMVENGNVALGSSNVALAVEDAVTDELVAGAVASFDLGVTVDGKIASELSAPLDVSIELDTSKYDAENYQVVRNHNGVIEQIETRYDAEPGVVTFSSDKYSVYSLVPCEAPRSEFDAQLRPSATSVVEGQTFTVDVVFRGRDIVAGSGALQYDNQAFELKSIAKGSDLSGGDDEDVSFVSGGDNPNFFSFFNNVAKSDDGIAVARFSFIAKKETSTTNISLEPGALVGTNDESGYPVEQELDVRAATVSMLFVARGDVNNNGRINIVDAQIVYDLVCGRYTSEGSSVRWDKFPLPQGWSIDTLRNVANVNPLVDDEVDAGDARAIQVYTHTGTWPVAQ